MHGADLINQVNKKQENRKLALNEKIKERKKKVYHLAVYLTTHLYIQGVVLLSFGLLVIQINNKTMD